MEPWTSEVPDVMQVCRSGHVVTDQFFGNPESGRTHCDRCGAETLDHCQTCGEPLPGAVPTSGLAVIGSRRAPRYCATCGAAFPWTRPAPLSPTSLGAPLEHLLRRLAQVVRELRWRLSDRPPYRIEDERDIVDLLRALLVLYCDDIRLESRTPRYSATTRTDLLLAPARIALMVKHVQPRLDEAGLRAQLKEDADYYRQRGDYRTVVCVVYDPEGRLPEPAVLERACSWRDEALDVKCVIAGLTAAR